MLRANDLRGRVGVDLGVDDAYALGLAFANAVSDVGGGAVGVGRDGRLSSPALEQALVRGLLNGGMQVHAFGIAPTPVVGFATRTYGLDAAITVTASHNPPDENGFKLELQGQRVSGAALAALVGAHGRARGGGVRIARDPAPLYLAALDALVDTLKPRRVVWDAGSGAAGPILRRVMARLPGTHLGLNTDVDGRFPSHHADPAVDANLVQLQRAVRDAGAELGIAFDGDGDRVGFVDQDGVIVRADQALVLLAEDALATRPGACIVGDIKCSRTLFERVSEAGGKPIMAATGYVRLGEAMRAHDAPIAGEFSGHIFFSDQWNGLDDGLYAALRVLRALDRRGGSLRDFRMSLPPRVASPEIRTPLPRERQSTLLARLDDLLASRADQVDRTDGFRVSSADGWWLARASATQSALTLRAEGETADHFRAIEADLRQTLHRAGFESAPLMRASTLH